MPIPTGWTNKIGLSFSNPLDAGLNWYFRFQPSYSYDFSKGLTADDSNVDSSSWSVKSHPEVATASFVLETKFCVEKICNDHDAPCIPTAGQREKADALGKAEKADIAAKKEDAFMVNQLIK